MAARAALQKPQPKLRKSLRLRPLQNLRLEPLQNKRQPKLPLSRPDKTYADAGGVAAFLLPAYFWRNFSTRPAVSTIFCLPV